MKAFDSQWRERLKDYLRTPEFKKNLKILKSELDQALPEEKPEKKLAFVFMGIPGSGKSALAQIIIKIYPAVILASCWIYFEKLKDQIEDDYYKAYTYQEKLARIYLRQGYSVIMDDNNRTIKNRAEVYQWARKNGAEPVLIKIDVNLETATDRRTLKGGEDFSREENLADMKVFVSQVEEPSLKEGVKIIRINGNLPLKEIAIQLKSEIGKI